MVPVKQIHEFKNHPFKVLDDEDMKKTIDSIREYGVLVPVIIRPDGNGEYEMISGHRRLHAASRAGLNVIPAIIKPMTNDEAVVAMVDANVQREEILPSERAWSLKMKMDAMRRQGARNDLTSRTQCGKSSAAQAGEAFGLKERQVQKYIRLTNLVEELLELVDNKKLTMGMAVDIEKRKKTLSIGTGGLSGPCVKPVALRMVNQVAKAVKIPVIGMGGISTAKDAIEFLMCGASAIEIGTANFLDPAVTIKVRDGINEWLDSHQISDVNDIIGVIQ